MFSCDCLPTRRFAMGMACLFLTMSLLCMDFFSIKQLKTRFIEPTYQDTEIMINNTYQRSDKAKHASAEADAPILNNNTADSSGSHVGMQINKDHEEVQRKLAKVDRKQKQVQALLDDHERNVTKLLRAISMQATGPRKERAPKKEPTKTTAPRLNPANVIINQSSSKPNETARATTTTEAAIQTTTTGIVGGGGGGGNITTQPQPGRHKKPYFKDANAHVIQIADANYAKKMEVQISRNRQWVNCSGYTYRLETPKTLSKEQIKAGVEPCMYTRKVQKIYQVLNEIPTNDWLIFLDIDTQYQATTCDAMERILPQQSKRASQPCEIIIHSSHVTINTAIVILKATNATRTLMQQWYELQFRKPVCHGPADQFALQEVILETYAPKYKETKKKCNGGGHRNRNTCFKRNFKESLRSVGNLCLMPCPQNKADPMIPLQCRDCFEKCEKKKAIFHHSITPRRDLPPLLMESSHLPTKKKLID